MIPFYSKPTVYTRTNQQSAWVNAGFVDLAELLSGDYIPTVSARPYICRPLSEEARLVLNLRHVNELVSGF